ncbi:MAG: UrcA family protein [Polymorphobacter sp.]|uniref:UrcA family protein n=1 Tax=Polymorphobacter sp. TaxID=1909290 RepID=UPI003A8B4B65
MMKILMPIAAMTMAAFAAPVLAQDTLTSDQIRIYYDKADLATERGRRAIERKIEFAVDRLCGHPVMGHKEESDMIRSCRTTARGMAHAQLPVTVAQN